MIQRGEIWWADLPEPRGSEPGFKCPLLIVQSEDFNRSRIQIVLCVVMTSNLRLAEAPGNVLLEKRYTGLPKDSVANVSQIMTVDKGAFIDKAGEVHAKLLLQIESGMKLVLGL